MYTTGMNSSSRDTQILILTSRDLLRKKLVDYLSLIPDIKIIYPESTDQIHEYISSMKFDLLFLDEDINVFYGENQFSQIIKKITAIPFVLFIQKKDVQNPISGFSGVVGNLQMDDISFQKIDDFIQKAKALRQLGVYQYDPSPDHSIVFRNFLQKKEEADRSFFELIIETTPNIIFVWDIKRCCISFVNNAVKNILGFSPEEVIEKKHNELIALLALDDLPGVLEHFSNIKKLKRNKVLEHEFHLRSKNRKWCWLKGQETVIFGEDNNTPIAIVGSLQNITTYKLMQQKLTKHLKREEFFSRLLQDIIYHSPNEYHQIIQVSLEKLRQLITPCLLLIYKNEGECFIKSHEVLSSRTNISFPDLLETNSINHLHETILLNKHILFNKYLDSESAPTDCFYSLFNDQVENGGIFPIISDNDIFGIMVLIPNDNRVRFTSFDFSVAKTVTSILSVVFQNQHRLNNPENYKKWSVDAIEKNEELMIVQFDTNGVITYANDLYCEYFESNRKDIIGKHFLEGAVHPARETRQSILKLFDQNHVFHTIENCTRTQSNDFRWQKWVCRAILDETGTIKEFQSIGQDITCRKKLENQLANSLGSMPELKLSSLGEFASGIAQQISNPLTTIIADSQILIQILEENNPARDSAEAILKAGQQVNNVVQELNKIPLTGTLQTVTIDVDESFKL
jgi:PAS domain S-box-containing protein